MRTSYKFPAFRNGSCIFSALLALGLLTGCGEPDVTEAVDRAQTHLAAGEFNAAAVELKSALQGDANNAKARVLLGEIYLSAGDGRGAEKEFSRALAAGYDSQALQLPLARAHLMTGKAEVVLQDVPEDLALTDRIALDLYTVRGEALMTERRLEEASAAFERVLAEEGVARAHGGLARIALHLGELEKAEKEVGQSLVLEPEKNEWHALKGEVHIRQTRYDDAIAAFEHFVNDDKGYAEGQVGYVRALVGAGQLERAKTWAEDLKKRAPRDPRVQLLSALLDLELGEFEAAKTAAEQVLARNDQHRRARFVAGAAAYHLGQFEGANRHLTQYLLSGAEDDPRAVIYLSATKLQLGQPGESYRLLQRNPQLAENSTVAASILAQAALQYGDRETGLALLERLAVPGATSAAQPQILQAAAVESEGSEASPADLVDEDPAMDAIAQRLILEQIRAGKLDEALDGAEKLTEKYPERAAGYILQGMVWLQKSGMGAADQYFRRAWEVDPGNPSAGLNLAQIEMNAGNNQNAVAILGQVVERNPDNLQALLFLADLEGRLGNADRREKLLRDAVAANSDSVQARILLSRHLLQQGRPTESLAVLQPSLQQREPAAAVLETAAIAHLMAQQPSQALGYLKNLQRLQPDLVQPHFLAAQAQMSLGRLTEAEAELKAALAVDEDHYESRRALAAVLQQVEKFPASLEQIEIAKEQRPTDPALADMEVRGQLATDNFAAAVAAAERAMEIAPATPRAIALAQAHWSAGDRPAAFDTMETWLDQRPSDAAAKLSLASLLFQDGQREQALQVYEDASQLQPDNAAIENDYAWALWLSGQKEEARERAEKAQRLAPEDPRMMDTLGVILVESGEAERGLALLQTASARMPDAPTVQFHLAQAYVKAGERDRAREILAKILDGGGVFSEREAAEALLQTLQD